MKTKVKPEISEQFMRPISEDWAERIKSGQWADYAAVLDTIKVALDSRQWLPGTPGWRAFFTPATPVEKAFQISVIYLLHAMKYEPYRLFYHKEEIKALDHGLKVAAQYLAKTLGEDLGVEALIGATGLKDTAHVSFTHQYCPGRLEDHPKSIKRLGGKQAEVYDALFHHGNLLRIKSTPDENDPDPVNLLADFGTLDLVFESAQHMAGKKFELGFSLT